MSLMRIFFLLGIFLATGISTAFAQSPFQKEVPADYGYMVKVGQQAPDFSLTLTDGANFRLGNMRGKVVMLQFTASWCGVCRKEMPHIEREIWQKHRNNPKFALLGIDLDEPLEKVVKFGSDVGVTYPLAPDPGGKVFYTYAQKGAGVTRNVIVDTEGKIVFLTRLFKQEEFDAMKNVIDHLLKP